MAPKADPAQKPAAEPAGTQDLIKRAEIDAAGAQNIARPHGWFPAQDNRDDCKRRAKELHHAICRTYQGKYSVEQIQDKKNKQQVKIKVQDMYEDERFPPDSETAWCTGGQPDELTDLSSMPKHWVRLSHMVGKSDPPFPEPQHGLEVRPGRVYQGVLENFYLVQALHALGMKPKLVQDVFMAEPDENGLPHVPWTNPFGFFIVRFYKHAQWMTIDVDDYLPVDKDFNPLGCTSEYYPNFSWPGIIEKAYCKLHGRNWEGCGDGGHCEEVLVDLTGGCASRFSTCDVAPDRLWCYLYDMNPSCVFGCQLNVGECARRNIPIEGHWAAAIYDVTKYNKVPYICVSLTAPIETIRALPCCNVPCNFNAGIGEGFCWLRIDDFHQLFGTIFECRLFNSDLPPPDKGGVPWSPAWKQKTVAQQMTIGGSTTDQSTKSSQTPLFEEMWACAEAVNSENSPTFLMDIDNAPLTITLEVSQTDKRFMSKGGRRPQTPLLLRFYQCSHDVTQHSGGEIHLVHSSAWGHCRDAMTAVKVKQNGKFLAMISIPHRQMGLNCNRMIFRTYSDKKINLVPIIKHRQFVAVCPGYPLNAIPYTMVGFARLDSMTERLPQMFDAEDGKGKPLAGQRKGLLGSMKSSVSSESKGFKQVGKFGGKDGNATVDTAETQNSSCSVM